MEGEWKWWDRSLNYLIHADPQAFLNFFFGKGILRFLRHVSQRLDGDKAIVDELFETEVIANRELLLVHLESETRTNAKMSRRLQKYNGEIRDRFDEIPAISCGLHLRNDTRLKSELVWRTPLPGWEEIMRFRHPTKELQDCTPEELRSYGHPALLVFIPLTQGGAEWEAVDAMLHDLEQIGDEELLKIGFGMADQCMSPENRQRLKKEYDMLYNKVLDDPLYCDLAQGWEERGRQEGRQEGLLEGIQRTLIAVTKNLFPDLLSFVQKIIPIIKDPLRLQDLIVTLTDYRNEEKAREALIALIEEISAKERAYNEMLKDPLYRAVVESREELGLQKGIQHGLQTAHQIVLGMIARRFPELRPLAEKVISAIWDSQRLQTLATAVEEAQTQEEVKRLLDSLSQEKII